MFRTSNKIVSRKVMVTAFLATMLSASALAYQVPSTNEVLMLPMGADAQHAGTSQTGSQSAEEVSNAQQAHQDGVARMSAALAADGAVQLGLFAPGRCPYKDPSDCG